MTDAGVLGYGRMAYRGDARRRPLFPFLPGLRIIFGSAGTGHRRRAADRDSARYRVLLRVASARP